MKFDSERFEQILAEVAKLEALNAEYNRLRNITMENMDRLHSWCHAYPDDIFIEVREPDWEKANEVLAAAGISMTAMNASNMRHVISGVKEIINNMWNEVDENTFDPNVTDS